MSRLRIVRKLPTFSNFTTTTSTGSREQLRMPPSISIQHFMIRGRSIHFGEMDMVVRHRQNQLAEIVKDIKGKNLAFTSFFIEIHPQTQFGWNLFLEFNGILHFQYCF